MQHLGFVGNTPAVSFVDGVDFRILFLIKSTVQFHIGCLVLAVPPKNKFTNNIIENI